jgi:hypothetical protein
LTPATQDAADALVDARVLLTGRPQYVDARHQMFVVLSGIERAAESS